jgi:hypothetical protein
LPYHFSFTAQSIDADRFDIAENASAMRRFVAKVEQGVPKVQYLV